MAASDPTYLRAFKDLTKSSPSIADRETMEKEFYGDSDRACGILYAGWVELLIESTLKQVFKKEVSAKLLDFEGPLGTFSAKIMMAYGLGVFGTKTNHDLLLIRTMRNGFAHCQLPLRFQLPEVKAVCDHFLIPDIAGIRCIPPYFYSLPDDRPDYLYDQAHPKTRFIICCYSIIHGLFEFKRTLEPRTPQSKLP
jgi:hypothetical protein